MKKFAHITATAGILALALAGCSPDQDQDADQASAANGKTSTITTQEAPKDLPEKWRYIAGTSDFTPEESIPQLQVTVTDDAKATVEIDDISKIISSGDNVSSLLEALGLGDKIAASPDDSLSAAGKAAPEHFEFRKNTGMEGLLALDGTLFIGDNLKRHGDVSQQFRDAGTDAVLFDVGNTTSDKIRKLSSFVGLPEEGDRLAESNEKALKEAQDIGSAEGKSIIQVTATGAGGQNSVAANGTPGTEMIEALGGISVGADAGLRGFSREMSAEGLVAADPDYILLSSDDYDRWEGEDGLWKAFPSLKNTTAGREANVIVMPDSQIKYTGPDSGVGALALAKALQQ